MKKFLYVVGVFTCLVILFASCKKDPTPDANGMVEIEMRRIVQMTCIGDTLFDFVIPEKQINWTEMEDQALKYTDSLGVEHVLSGGILNADKYKIKVPAPPPPQTKDGSSL
jgi:hypothetical protein